jgi:F0F1-type ATP synthase membrane subunit b/b'
MQIPDLSLFVVMAIFWATYWVLRLSVFRPLGAILEEREHLSSRAAEALRVALEKEREAVAEVDRRLNDVRREVMTAREAARQSANAGRQQVLDRARAEAQQAVQAAQARLDTTVRKTRDELRASAEAIALEIASAALGRKVA